MNLQTKWNKFVDEVADKMATLNKEESELLRVDLKKEFPPDEESLTWAKAYILFQQQGVAFVYSCISQNRFQDAMIVSYFMEALNKALPAERKPPTINEFCKEVKFP